MNNQNNSIKVDKQKKIIICFLYLGTAVIMFLGVFFSAYSVINDIKLNVLNNPIPGVVFGLLLAYLGAKYFFMVSDFETAFYMSAEKFSWNNFKKEKRKRKISGTNKIKLITGR